MHHNNFYLIRKLSYQLESILSRSRLYECYSQNKDELVLGFVKEDKNDFFIVANLGSEFSCLHFPEEVNRARRNTITLFEEIIGKGIVKVIQYENERVFGFEFEEGFILLFKLFGNRSNILLFHNDKLIHIFKSNLKQDLGFKPSHRTIELTLDNLRKNNFLISKVLFTADELFVRYLETKGYSESDDQEKMQKVEELVDYLNNPLYYVTKVNSKVVLSLFPIGDIIAKYTQPIEAINAFYSAHFRYNFLASRKDKLVASITSVVKSIESYLLKTTTKLQELEAEKSPSQIADLIMANLHQIRQGSEKVRLFDFYSGEEIDIKLKKDLSPQKNAELLYRKAKKKPVEAENLLRQIDGKEKQLLQVKNDLKEVEEIVNHKDLEKYEWKYRKVEADEEKRLEEKFKVYEVMGFKILVGRNADNNDELTQKYASKNDLWLHAKDVPGSHVVIKYQAGKNFPKPVIESAASLAAYYSKRKNETLCPVIVTEKKFVRKVKGAVKGEVKIDRESVIMVVPKDL